MNARVLPRWIDTVSAALIAAHDWNRRDTRWQFMLPYRLQPTERADVLCVVNREYKLVGINSNEWCDYETAFDWHTHADVFDLMRLSNSIGERGHLYTDATAPWLSKADFRTYGYAVEQLLALARTCPR